MKYPFSRKPWKDKPPEEKWTAVGLIVGFVGTFILALLLIKNANQFTIGVLLAVGMIVGAAVGRIAYERFGKTGSSA